MKVGAFVKAMLVVGLVFGQPGSMAKQPIIIDHTCIDIIVLPEWAIQQAKETLHIAYGHTSHGSQITEGMQYLVGFANKGGKGLALPNDIFQWNDGGKDGALDLHDYAMGSDVGRYPEWVNSTRDYLEDPQHHDVNIIMWSWCGQVSGKYMNGRLFSEYIHPMAELESDYPHITFVYMTGHVDHLYDEYTKAANQIIRAYCKANGKVLYDFADIESHDPDGNYYAFPDDNCDYYASRIGERLGNWAVEWQETHLLGRDWYKSGAAHSESLNANMKAYAAWWLFARLGGWPGPACPCDANSTDASP
jgi:hypothetical protein